MDDVQIIILAAGKGTRMDTEGPKALAPLASKPFLKHILDTLDTLNLSTPPVIVVGYQKEAIFKVIGIERTYAVQQEQLGTGHAVMSAEDKVNKDKNITLIISTDQPLISKETIENIVAKYKEHHPTITLATALLPDWQDWRAGLRNFGRIIRGNDGKLQKIKEYKDANEQERNILEVNPAIYAFDSSWLWENIDKLSQDNAQKEYYITDLIKLAREQDKDIETVELHNTLETIQPNSKEELDILENLMPREN